MNKPEGYDNEQGILPGENTGIEPGGYICRIDQAHEEKAKKSGRPMLVLYIDIAEGAYEGYYRKRYNANTKPDKKWQGIYRQLTDGNSTKFFKGLIEAIEKSNPGYTWQWDEMTLTGKLIGGVFGEEEYIKADGGAGKITKLQYATSIQAIKEGRYSIPKPAMAPADEKRRGALEASSYGSETVIDDEDLPF